MSILCCVNGLSMRAGRGGGVVMAALLAAGALANTPTSAVWTARTPGFVVENFAGGFTLPVKIAVRPSPGAAADAPLMYVAELHGQIRLVRRNGAVSTYASGLLNFSPGAVIPGAGEQGLTGLCIEPVSGDVIAAIVYDSAPPGGARFGRIVRIASGDGGVTGGSPTTILDLAGEDLGAGGLGSQMGDVSIGPDGKLYVNVGDGGVPASAQDPAMYRGKVLRMNLDGTAPADNPLFNGADGITATDYVFALGLRRPMAGAWRASDGSRFLAEPGPVTTDRLTRQVRNRNYLWDGAATSMTNFALYNWSPTAVPLNIALVQSAVFSGSGFPSNLWGRMFIAESGPLWTIGPLPSGRRVTYSFVDATGTSAGAPTAFVEYTGFGRATCSAVAAGPDGLYFTELFADNAAMPTDSGANLLRVRYVGVADYTTSAVLTATEPPLTVDFADASLMPGGSGASGHLWEFGDGTSSTLASVSHTYTAPGEYVVRYTATGAAGPSVAARRTVVRIGAAPALAYIAGAATPSTTDNAVANHLRSLGFTVTMFDDEPANRPSAATLAAGYGGVIVSSSITAANVGSEFRTAAIPMVFWEGGILTTAREALASGSTTLASQLQISITNASHPVMEGLPAGPVTMFGANQTLNLASGTIAPNAAVLATATGNPNQPAVMAANAGATLLSNYVTPARRVFLFFNDTSFGSANNSARCIMSNAACWACGLKPAVTAQPAAQNPTPGQTAVFSITSTGHPLRTYQWRRNGEPIFNGDLGGRVSGAGSPMLTIASVAAGDEGSYDVVVTTGGCGTATSASAALTLPGSCAADFNGSGSVTVQDVFDFLAAYFSGAVSADVNGSGSVTVQDVFDFLAVYFAGC